MKNNLIVILSVLLFVALSTTTFVLYIKNQNNKLSLIPRFSTPDLPAGKVASLYEADIFGSLIGAKAKMEIISLESPDGLKITDCKQNYNLDRFPKPNTVISCKIKGITPSETTDLKLQVKAKGYNNSVIQIYKLTLN